MKKITIETTDDESIYIILEALDLYTRLNIGQFDSLLNLRSITKNNESDITQPLTQIRNQLFDLNVGLNGSHGIHSNKVDDSARLAFDIRQVIRHELWKNNPNRNSMTVDSSVHFTSKQGLKDFKCTIENSEE